MIILDTHIWIWYFEGDSSRLDDGDMWPVSFALTRWTPEVEARIAELVRAAVS